MEFWGALFHTVVRTLLSSVGFSRLCHIIAVDRFSHDDTLNILRTYANNKLQIIQTEANLAQARKLGLSFADAEIVLMVDSDVILNKTFIDIGLKILSKFKKVGAVAAPLCKFKKNQILGRAIEVSRIIIPVSSVKSSYLVKHSLDTLVRGYTFAVLIRRQEACDWNPPPDLSAYEDFSLSQHIVGKGLLWIEVTQCVYHIKEYRVRNRIERLIKQGLWEGSNARKVLPLRLALLNAGLRTLFGVRDIDFLRRISYLIGLLTRCYDVWKRI